MLNRIIAFSIDRKGIVALMTLLLVIWGVWSATRLSIDAVPDITNNQVQIITLCPTLASQEVEQLVTYPIEQSIANLPGLVESRSISRFGLSVITVVFTDQTDVYFARQLINERLKDAEEHIPKGAGKPELAPASTGLGEVYQYIIHTKPGSESKYSAMDLRTIQDWIVARQLYGTVGIAEVNSFGGQLKQYEVAFNPSRLAAMDVSVSEIFASLERNNENTGGAYIDKKPNSYFIRGVGLVNTLESIGEIVVKVGQNGVPILVKDVAEVRFGSAVRYGAMTYNGEKDAVGGVVMMLKGANSADVVARVKERMKTIAASLPSDVVIEPYLDRTNLVGRAMSTVETNLLEGAAIVIFVLITFLGNARAGLIVASAIPLAMLFALGMMNLFGISANLMSLGALDFGLIVDGAVIIVEAVFHQLYSRVTTMGQMSIGPKEIDTAVYDSASSLMNSAVFGQVIILIVYLPILTLVGIEGKMFRPMAQTVAFAVLGALLLSLTYIPMATSVLLRKGLSLRESLPIRAFKKLELMYTVILKVVVKHKRPVVIISLVIFFASCLLFSRLGSEFIPTLAEGDFAFHCILPQGTSLSQSIETSMQASRLAKEFDEVKMVVGKTGSAEVPTDPMPPEATDLMIILKTKSQWKRDISYEDLADEMVLKLRSIPGVFFEKNQPIQMRFNELMTGVRQDVAVKIFGENLDTLLLYAGRVASEIRTVHGATEPMVEQIEGLPQIVVRYNRQQLANYGLNIEELNHIVSTAFAGGKAGVVYENERRFDLVIRLDSAHRSSLEDIGNVYVPVEGGRQIPLSQVASIQTEIGPAQISREDGKRRIVIGFNVQDRDVASVVDDIQQKLTSSVHLPEGYFYRYGGTFENLQAATQRLMIAVPIALVLIFLLLYFTFSSIRLAAIIYTAIPMSAIGGVLALYLRDMPFSISAGIGFIALFGVSVLNGIVLVSTFQSAKQEGLNTYEAILKGSAQRLRPVLMTATVASLGFLPMALSHSAGAEVQKPLATVVIGGLFSATLLTLFVLPLLYVLFSRTKSGITQSLVVLAVIVSSALTPICAEAQPRTLTVDDAVDYCLKNSEHIRAQQLDVRAAELEQSTAYVLPKTELNYQSGQFNSIARDNAFSIQQGIPFPTLYAAQSARLRAALDNKKFSQALTIQEVRSVVRLLCNRIQYLSQLKSELSSQDTLYERFVDVSARRVQEGAVSSLEHISAVLEINTHNQQVARCEAELTANYQLLRSSINYPGDFVILPDTAYLQIDNVLADSTRLHLHPAVRLLASQATLAEKQADVEAAQDLPELKVGYTSQTFIGSQTINGVERVFDATTRFGGFSVGMALPLTFFNSSARASATRLTQEALLAETQSKELSLTGLLSATMQRYYQLRKQYSYYQEEGLLQAYKLSGIASAKFSEGEINYVEYAHAIQSASSIRQSFLQVIMELGESYYQILDLYNK